MNELMELSPLLGEALVSAEPMWGMLFPPRAGETRSPERIRVHFDAERRLAARLKAARGPEERREIFAVMYDELFTQVPDHPRLLAQNALAGTRDKGIEWDLAQLRPYLRSGDVLLEIGAGDCALSRRVAGRVARVYAVDVSDQTLGRPLPANVQLVLSDGRSVPVPEGSVDVAFSDQLMEHLHPQDALEQLRNIHRALKPGGAYVCITPNRMYGPTDVSGYFGEVAQGFHLKEYTLRELRGLLRGAGFHRFHTYIGARGLYMRCPAFVVMALERALERLPYRLRRRIADTQVMRALLGLRLAAFKSR